MQEFEKAFACRQCQEVKSDKFISWKSELNREQITNEAPVNSIQIKQQSDRSVIGQIEAELMITQGYLKSSNDLESYDEETDYIPSFEED